MAAEARPPKVFISYRRDDTQYVASHLAEKLIDSFGPKQVFMDVDAIPAGSDFRRVLREAVGGCDVVVALIGKNWLGACDEQGQRRLDSDTDWVRIELETALDRGIPLIPLLVDNAKVPEMPELPEPLRELAYRQALPLRSGRDFEHDIDVLRTGSTQPRSRDP